MSDEDQKKTASLKFAVKTLWQLENELRYSAWSALALNKEKAQSHLSEARRHLNVMLDEVDPPNHVPDLPPSLPDDKA